MAPEPSSAKLPSELFDEKSFYTLGGASAGVLLTCWAINFVLPDLPAEAFRVFALVLSELFAILIMTQSKNTKATRWLFAFLNGLLIFANASGFNAMTASYNNKMNSADTTGKKSSGYFFNLQDYTAESYQQASLFPLPRMINWWPDNRLIGQNEQLLKKNQELATTNQKLLTLVDTKPGGIENNHAIPADSLAYLVKTLRLQLTEKQKQLEECNSSAHEQGDASQQLIECIRMRNSGRDSLIACKAGFNRLKERMERMRNTNENCIKERDSYKTQLDECNNQANSLKEKTNALNNQIIKLSSANTNLSLTDHIKQACGQPTRRRFVQGYTPTDDDRLIQQGFWKTFCASFSAWNSPIK